MVLICCLTIPIKGFVPLYLAIANIGNGMHRLSSNTLLVPANGFSKKRIPNDSINDSTDAKSADSTSGDPTGCSDCRMF